MINLEVMLFGMQLAMLGLILAWTLYLGFKND